MGYRERLAECNFDIYEAKKNGKGKNGKNGNKSGGKENGGKEDEYRKPVSGKSDKEAADDVPSWAKGEQPYKGEDGKAFAKRLLEKMYGKNNYKTGPDSEYNKIKKWGDCGFEK